MKLLIDSANIDDIKYVYKNYPVDGVTTNPSILLKAGKEPYSCLDEIVAYFNEASIKNYELHIQVISTNAKGMIDEAVTQIQDIPTEEISFTDMRRKQNLI